MLRKSNKSDYIDHIYKYIFFLLIYNNCICLYDRSEILMRNTISVRRIDMYGNVITHGIGSQNIAFENVTVTGDNPESLTSVRDGLRRGCAKEDNEKKKNKKNMNSGKNLAGEHSFVLNFTVGLVHPEQKCSHASLANALRPITLPTSARSSLSKLFIGRQRDGGRWRGGHELKKKKKITTLSPTLISRRK